MVQRSKHVETKRALGCHSLLAYHVMLCLAWRSVPRPCSCLRHVPNAANAQRIRCRECVPSTRSLGDALQHLCPCGMRTVGKLLATGSVFSHLRRAINSSQQRAPNICDMSDRQCCSEHPSLKRERERPIPIPISPPSRRSAVTRAASSRARASLGRSRSSNSTT